MISEEDALEYLKANLDAVPLVRKALEDWKKWAEKPKVYDWERIYIGFRYFEIEATPPQLQSLVRAGIFTIVDRSNSGTRYGVSDADLIGQALERLDAEASQDAQEMALMPTDLFSPIIGYEEAKELFLRAIEAPRPVHLLMVGPAASAKTMMLMEIQRIPGAEYHLGSSTSRAGLATVLLERKPRYLTIDEVDKMPHEDQEVLLSLCETGLVKETKWGRLRQAQLDTRVFAAANRINRIRPEILSRFEILEFPPYSPEEFSEVVFNVLTKREGLPSDVAEFVAQTLWKRAQEEGATMVADPRQAVRLARLMRNPSIEEAQSVLKMIGKYGKKTLP